jgi:hypothetical protein
MVCRRVAGGGIEHFPDALRRGHEPAVGEQVRIDEADAPRRTPDGALGDEEFTGLRGPKCSADRAG